MAIAEKEAKKRIKLATSLEDVFLQLFSLISLQNSLQNKLNQEYLTDFTTQRYSDAVEENDYQDSSVENYFLDMIPLIVASTLDNSDDEYYLSEDRAMYIAENEANAIANNFEFAQKVREGYTKKTWVTKHDTHVRHTHISADGQTVDILKPFQIGNSLMMYPKDYETYGAEAKETVNCRCVCKYSGNREFAKYYDSKIEFNNGENEFTNVKQDVSIEVQKDESIEVQKDESILMNTLLLSDEIDIVSMLIENPKIFSNYSPIEIKSMLEKQGYNVKPLSHGKNKGITFEEGGGFKVNIDGNCLISYNPTGTHHGNKPYYKISNAENGIRRYDLNGDLLDD